MANKFTENLQKLNPFRRTGTEEEIPVELLPVTGKRMVRVYVEGYDDVAFWRGIFDHFDNPYLHFDISVPTLSDLPKGKRILMSMIPQSGEDLLLCVDSDFDHLFGDATQQSRELNAAQYMFHTYAYATENYLCYAPSLHNVCVKATKNDRRIFDFEWFMAEYSRTIYPLFVWYACSARSAKEHVFTLADFRTSVRLGYVEVPHSGADTIAWLGRNVARREQSLRTKHPDMIRSVEAFDEELRSKGVLPHETYLYMHGHTLMDNVAMIALGAVCDRLRRMSIDRIKGCSKAGTALKNEFSNYTNAQRSIRDVLLDNENYTSCHLYERLRGDIETYISRTVRSMRDRGDI